MIDVNEIRERLLMTRDAAARFAEDRAADLAKAAEMTLDTYKSGNKVLIFGNGGSAAEAQHVAAELVNRMCFDRAPLPAIALTTDSSVVTSIANDYDFDSLFEKQVLAHGNPGDLAWGLSTSGKSANVIRALKAAREKGLKTLAMAGAPGSPIADVADLALWVDQGPTAVVQEIHLAASHIICALVERELFGEGG